MRLAVRSRSPPSRHYDGLRHSAVWYPTVPPQNLCLNEESFISRDICSIGFKPLFWSHFGGPGGKYLRHLTGISAVSCLGILRIHFAFDIEVPWEHRSFGRLKLEEEYENSTDFSIDGPGGERIVSIKMRYLHPSPEENEPEVVKEASMIRCKVSSSPPLPALPPSSERRSQLRISSFTQTADARAEFSDSDTKIPGST